jgi:autotransporter-associated beta strand protein
VHAQKSGTWISIINGEWSDETKWSPDVPDDGGNATFMQLPLQSSGRTVTLDDNFEVGKMMFDSTYLYTIGGTGTPALTMSGMAELDVVRSNPSSPSAFAAGHLINRPITGTSGLSKTGPGNVTLSSANTYSGGTTVTEGVLRTTVGDAAFGTALSPLTVNGGRVRYSVTASGFNRPVTLGANHATFETFVPITFGGVVSGPGNFNKEVGAAIAFEAANTYTGASNFQATGTQINGPQTAGNIIYRNGGSALNTSNIASGGVIVLDNTMMNLSNRLPAVDTWLLGSGVTLLGNNSASTTESLGNTWAAGQTFFTVTPGTGQSAQLTMNSLSKMDKGTVVYRGTNLGAAPGANVANVFLTAPPTLTGGGGAPGSANISIIKGAIGATSSTSAGDSFVTYGATGVRPLAATEYATLAAAGATDNVRVTSATNLAASKTVNAVVVATGGSITGPATLTVTSGQFLNTATATHSVNVDFGATSGVITTPSPATLSGVISGSDGLVKSGAGDLTLTGLNTYTGPTTIAAGRILGNDSVRRDIVSPLGQSSQPLVFRNYGGTPGRYHSLISAVFERDIEVRGNGSGIAGLGTTGNFPFTVNGNILLDRQLNFEGGNATAPMIVNGVISGTGRLSDSNGAYTILNAANPFSGGIEVGNGGFLAGNDQAYGTGPIWVVGAGAIGASGGDRTIDNDIVLMSNITFASTATHQLTINGRIDMAGVNPATGDGAFVINTPANTGAVVNGTVSDGMVQKNGAGSLRFHGDNTYGGGTTVNEGWFEAKNLTGGKLTVNGGWASIRSNPTPNSPVGTSVIPDWDINAPGQLDVGNNTVVVDYEGPVGMRVSDTWQMLSDGRLYTSDAIPNETGLGYGDNALLGYTTFSGKVVDFSSVLIKYTFLGDTDLSGGVDVEDLGNLASAWQTFGFWGDGDSDYNWFIDVGDLGNMASNWQKGVPNPLGPSWEEALASFGLPSVGVPEPAALAPTVAALTLTCGRRRRPCAAC